MGEISDRADRFIRQVYKKKAKVTTPEQKTALERAEKLMVARKRAVGRRKGY